MVLAVAVVSLWTVSLGLITVRLVQITLQSKSASSKINYKPPLTIKDALNEMVPFTFRSDVNLASYLLQQIRIYHCLLKTFAKVNNNDQVSPIMALFALLGHVLGMFGASIALSHLIFLRAPCGGHKREGDCDSAQSLGLLYVCHWREGECATGSVSDYLEDKGGLFQLAALLSLLAALISLPVQSCCCMLASLLEDLLAALEVQRVHPHPGGMEESKEEEEGEEEYGQELQVVQTKRGTLLRAAKCFHMRKTLDYVPIRQELELVLTRKKMFPWPQLPEAFDTRSPSLNYLKFLTQSLKHRLYAPGDPSQAMKLIVHSWLLTPGLILRRLRHSRIACHALRSVVRGVEMHSPLVHSHRDCSHIVDSLLVRLFFVHWFSGSDMRVLYTLLIEEGGEGGAELRSTLRLSIRNGLHVYRTLLFLGGVFACYLGVVVIVAYYALSLSEEASLLSVCSLLLASALYLSAALPLRILFTQLYLPMLSRSSFLRLHKTCCARFRYVLGRERGVFLPSEHHLLQHLHPVCRLARFIPQYSVARLLIGMRDCDLYPAMQTKQFHIEYRIESSASSGSPLVVDFLQVLCSNSLVRLRYLFWRYLHYFSLLQRIAVHVLLLLPRNVRMPVADGLCLLFVYGSLYLLYYSAERGTVPLVLSLVALSLSVWSVLAHCFLFRGPLQIMKDAVLWLYNKYSAYIAKEKKKVRRKKTRGIALSSSSSKSLYASAARENV